VAHDPCITVTAGVVELIRREHAGYAQVRS
jgi:intracellular sulfur oxidation DsrE/DsrF family protein